ncbi:MAG TPA: HypC/HybG/HupF family hydrogenase formation chaperone [Thermoanaerobaculia bacterium]|nr:HypC/HybG/HupF family hydrogenase formation chaperone [Thermoanaerobaculia bacterium]
MCADAGEVAEVVALDADELGRALVRRADGTEELVALDLVEVVTGERVLVHLGFAICKVGET